jgi:hypothetical protein
VLTVAGASLDLRHQSSARIYWDGPVFCNPSSMGASGSGLALGMVSGFWADSP